MDKYADDPKEFVRKVLQDNTKALAILVKENKNDGEDLTSSIMKKMSLDMLSGDNKDNFAGEIGKALKELVRYIKGRTGAEENDLEKSIETILNNKTDADLNRHLLNANTTMEESIKASANIMQDNVCRVVEAMFEKTELVKDEDELIAL